MRKYEVQGLLAGKKSGKVTRTVEAVSKQEIWNNPSALGFSKLFSVKEINEVYKGN
jgi:hypothetical protein